MPESRQENIFSVRPLREDTLGKKMVSLFQHPIARITALHQCDQLYRRIHAFENPETFLDGLLSELAVTPVLRRKGSVPASGPLVVVANHPFGAIEGVILARYLLSIRPDVKVLANGILARIPQLRDIFIAVDPFQTKQAMRANLAPLRQAIDWVNQGGALLTFPSGTVSHIHLSRREVADPQWQPGIGKIIEKTGAAVLPIHVGGSNGRLFQVLGLVHPLLRTAMIPRELVNKRRCEIPLTVGALLPHAHLKKYITGGICMDYLRWRTYLLGGEQKMKKPFLKKSTLNAIAPPMDPRLCEEEIQTLPEKQLLMSSGPFRVFLAFAHQIPCTFTEICRLREECFRLAGEGTGKALDTDRFDAHYRHIFIWNSDTREVVGAYRLGCVDEILSSFGKKGLYTATLFNSRKGFYEKLGPALELGRSFVRPEYQKSYSPLLLLWKGIGKFVADNPQYRTLFGPVSISRDYSDMSRHLIADTLLRHHGAKDIAGMVRPKTPPALKSMRVRGCSAKYDYTHTIEDLDSLVADLEGDSKGIPILLKHYMKLGGKLLAFNVDRDFGNALDGLILVDLAQNNSKTLERYLGKEGTDAFLRFHTHGAPADREAA